MTTACPEDRRGCNLLRARLESKSDVEKKGKRVVLESVPQISSPNSHSGSRDTTFGWFYLFFGWRSSCNTRFVSTSSIAAFRWVCEMMLLIVGIHEVSRSKTLVVLVAHTYYNSTMVDIHTSRRDYQQSTHSACSNDTAHK